MRRPEFPAVDGVTQSYRKDTTTIRFLKPNSGRSNIGRSFRSLRVNPRCAGNGGGRRRRVFGRVLSGLGAILTSVPIAIVEAIRHWRATRSTAPIDIRRAAVVGGTAILVAVAMVFVLRNASTHTIVQRGTLGYLPFVGDRGIVNSANELLWERFGYGPAAIEMIKEHPIDGIGIGTFHALAIDYGRLVGYPSAQHPNALGPTTRKAGSGTSSRSSVSSAASRCCGGAWSR